MNQKRFSNLVKLALVFGLVSLSISIANAQTQNPYTGGYNTGYGTVYGTPGQARATQQIYINTQRQIQQLQAREAMVKQFGLAAVEELEREGKASWSPYSHTKDSGSSSVASPPSVERNHGIFRPDKAVDIEAIADELFKMPQEKAVLKPIFLSSIAELEEVASTEEGWKNNIAGALTIFTVVAASVYQDVDSPSDDVQRTYFKAVNHTLNKNPGLATLPDKDKQTYYYVLLGSAGILKTIYMNAKQKNDAEGLANSKQFAGNLIESYLKTSPDNIRFDNK
jgi:hypothetical protein